MKKIKIGNTPLVYLNGLYLKLESYNESGSIKDRPAFHILETLFKQNKLKENDTIIEATSGNMGISLAMLSKYFHINVVIVMPNNMSKERIQIMKNYGAEVILTNAEEGMNGSIKKAEELAVIKGYYPIHQFDNPLNSEAHITTAQEIFEQLPDVDYVICGIGTGGTITGVSQNLKRLLPNVRIIGVEPLESPFITKGEKGLHGIQGIGAGFWPSILNLQQVEKVETVSTKEVLREAKKDYQVSLGLTSLANIIVGKRILTQKPQAKILIICPDGIEKYRSVIK